ncbi:hypothetical protein NM208_g5728 [Fusarium decemcellulare]|uniref:Uncharacterized protein n=1 Tax=Fusarium decemcellulare TaxID=57161 RepID=A0ACC1SFR6_9HYPO|nr:hypothetical protein NM208_g5728 [Fusarium decemcellulare]
METRRDPNGSTPAIEQIKCENTTVLIVGAGPVGLFLALKLSLRGIDVIVLEAESTTQKSPRATTYMPITISEMEKVGLADDLMALGHVNREGITFRKPHFKGGEILASLRFSQIPKGSVKYDFAGVHLGQKTVTELILEHCHKQPSFKIRWNHRFAGLQQQSPDEQIHALVVTPEGEKKFICDYLVGADGAGSAVRRSQCIPFEGYTWKDFRFVACNIKYDFEVHGFDTANMIIDDDDWAVIARTGPGDEPWRVAFGMPPETPSSDLLNYTQKKFERIFPGPRPLKYDLVQISPYWAHQRVADTWKVGKVTLCGDAAHSNNPIGGFGLTAGFLDSAALGNCLIRIILGGEDAHSLLRRYAEVRRSSWLNFTNVESVNFKLRLHSNEPSVVSERDAFFEALNNDPEIALKMASKMNVQTCSHEKIVEAFQDLDVLVSEYGPHGGENPFQYQPFLETNRKIILGAKGSRVPYFIMVGGCGSLNMPGSWFQTCSESEDFWLAYHRSIADSLAHIDYMEKRFGNMEALRKYRESRLKLLEGEDDPTTREFVENHEREIIKNDRALNFITACRTSYMFFEGNTSFKWTFVSPPPMYRSGTRTGTYQLSFDELPLKASKNTTNVHGLEGRLTGISAADLAIAIGDEIEAQQKAGRHWTAYGDVSDGKVGPVVKSLALIGE